MAARNPEPSTTAPAAAAPADLDLLALLTEGDLERYRALFADAAGIADPHARYGRRRELVELALLAARDAPPARGAAIRRAVVDALVPVLEDEPREPVLLNYAGVAFADLWELRAAVALFDAALRLAPELDQAKDNRVAAVRRGRAGGRPAPPVPRATAAGLRDLGRRAARAAARARPREGLRLSLCMIVKDEEEMLPRCLSSVVDVVDEIVVVDTGSSDRTVEIARSFGARVLEFPWTGSFAEARNVSLDAATGDWLWVLDADEALVVEDGPRLRELLGRTWREAFYLSEIHYTGELGDGSAVTNETLRIFRARPEYRYTGALHEQITHTLPPHAERIESSGVRIEHYGYLGAVRDAKEKSQRNLELLERQRDEQQGDPFFHFNLGSEYAVAGEQERALQEFERSWEALAATGDAPRRGFAPTLARRLVRSLRLSGRAREAQDRAEEALALFPDFTDLVYEQGLAAQALGRTDEAVALFERCRAWGDAPERYSSLVGAGTYLPAIALAEIELQRGAPARAVALLEETLADHPDFYGLALPLATALLADGATPEEVVRRVEARVEAMTPTFRFLLGTALYERREVEAAEEQFRLVLAEQPGSGRALVALAEALLSQRRWAEAAEVAAQVGDDDQHAAAARRSELFALLVAGERERADAVLARAGDAGLPAADRALFAAWAAALGGAADADPLPADATPLLCDALEALLRVAEVDAFGTLVPLLDRCPLPERERRELLASMYLRQGFLASAAEEWLAVCAHDPGDVRALIGLAQTAAAQGMVAEALDFAREARALDPGDDRAARLVERLEPQAA